MAAAKSHPEVVNENEAQSVVESAQPSTRRSIFRSIPFQIAVASAVSFTAPGMWDALNNLGAGGAAEPYAVSAANALVYGLFAIVCVAAGAINNRIGLRYGLTLGAIGYPIYGAGLYTNNNSANTWFMLFGSALCGISAGFFWAAEAAIIIGYPSPHERAFYLGMSRKLPHHYHSITDMLNSHLANRKGCWPNRGRCNQLGPQCANLDNRIRQLQHVHCVHRHHVPWISHRPPAQSC